MKLNPLEWNEVDETSFEADGLLLLRSSQPFALSVEAFGVAVAVGAETAHRIPLPEKSKVTIVGGKAKVYRKEPPSRLVVSNEETFTNIDRLPQESGTVEAVTRAHRLFKLEQRAIARKAKEEAEFGALVEAARQSREAPPEPKAEAKAKAEAEAKAEA